MTPLPKTVKMCLVDVCPRTATSDKWCVVHFIRFTRSGDPLRNKWPRKPSLQQQFEGQYVEDPSSGCWLWLGNVDAYGHGRIGVPGADGKRRRKPAHCLSWELFVGPVPPGLVVTQAVCGDNGCVRPDHLGLTTRSALALLANARRRAVAAR